MYDKPVTIADWTHTLGTDDFGPVVRTERVAILSESPVGDITVIELREDGDWSGLTRIAYASELHNRRPGVASPSGRIFELAH